MFVTCTKHSLFTGSLSCVNPLKHDTLICVVFIPLYRRRNGGSAQTSELIVFLFSITFSFINLENTRAPRGNQSTLAPALNTWITPEIPQSNHWSFSICNAITVKFLHQNDGIMVSLFNESSYICIYIKKSLQKRSSEQAM